MNYHNKQARDLDISVHFNAYEQVSKPMGVEVLYVTQQSLASESIICHCVGRVNQSRCQKAHGFVFPQ